MAFKDIYAQYRVSFLGLGVLLLLVLGGIVPTLLGMASTQNRIALLQVKLENQKAFMPLNATLKVELKKLQDAQADWKQHMLPAPADMNQALDTMQILSGMARLQAPRFTPVSDSVLGRKNQLKIEAQLSAPSDEFRHFLYLTTLQPWVIRVDALGTQAAASGSHNGTVSLWVQLNVTPVAANEKAGKP